MVEGVRNFEAMRISATGLSAERTRMDVLAENIANSSTTRTEGGGPYQRKIVVLGAHGDGPRTFRETLQGALPLAGSDSGHLVGGVPPAPDRPEVGVAVDAIQQDTSEGPLVFDPTHPDANADGYVRYPNVEMAQELMTLVTAARAYEANLAVMRTAQEAARETLRIGR